MDDILFFDAFTQIGPRPKKHLAHPWKLQELIAEMEHCSISGALVSSTQSVQYDPMHANLELSASLKKHDHLFALWNVFPHHTGEFPEPKALATAMEQHNVRAVTIYPHTNNWDWQAEHAHELFRSLERGRILMLIKRGEIGQWRDLETILKKYPALPVLLTGVWWTEQRNLLPLLTRQRNLHIGFDTFQIHYGLESLTAAGLENQLVFASNAPQMSMGAHRCYVDYANIAVESKRRIAGKNLTRLLMGQRPPRLNINTKEDAVMTAARRGQPLPVKLIDMHMHILHEGLNGAGGTSRMERGGPKGVFPMLKRLGYAGGGFMSWNVVSCDSMAGNETVRQTLDAAPKGYWGLGSFDPTHYSQSELKTLIPQVYKDPRFIGMKPYWTYGVEYHHRSYDVWWSYGNRNNLYALIHRTRNDFKEVDELAKKYRHVRWVIAHCGESHQTADLAIESMLKHPNVFAEITLTPVTLGVIDYLVEHAGAERVVYGTDLPMRDPRQQLGWVVFSRLSLANKKKVLGENALKVIAPCAKQLPAYNRP